MPAATSSLEGKQANLRRPRFEGISDMGFYIVIFAPELGHTVGVCSMKKIRSVSDIPDRLCNPSRVPRRLP